ncbi:helix-turn-helix transcriptional regulator [Chitinophaga polysaccharea]|uniref:helix-turn-helix domain-containing protein n=1 Tax=Chitinophaga polysaccharea TaxID=1293035 RepID=UPI001455DA67|nr:helix-turn-helix transcriptional regulator [Chitinophaga polysaccharea]NLR57407.1 helix-turn-helix transcriptional regulator [Chitinophaga polysaccharea]
MKKDTNIPPKINSISEFHKLLGFPKPLHPLVSLVNYADIKIPYNELPKILLLNFYKVSYMESTPERMKYGQDYYDFDEGGLSFVSPNQIISCAEIEESYSGFTLLIHPDFIRNYPLLTKIKNYGFFSYSANEALFVSDKEKQIIFSVFDNIRDELNTNIDDFSQDVVISYIEVLLNYSKRFYKRQFITRKAANTDLVVRMENILNDHFEQVDTSQDRLLTVEYLAGKLNVSPRYLSDMLRSQTGQNAQQHIHDKLIEKAKEYLTTTNLSVSEIAYQLGFEHSQSFNKLFKKKTSQTPMEFKQTFN